MFDRNWDATVRNAALEWLKAQVATYGDVLPRTLLVEGFPLDGARVPLLSPKGIFKPRVLREAPLSITTAPNGAYDDAFGPNDLLRYRYRGEDPEHPDNRGLRFAMQERLPLVYLHGLVPGRYVPAWPVFVVGDHRDGLTSRWRSTRSVIVGRSRGQDPPSTTTRKARGAGTLPPPSGSDSTSGRFASGY